MYAAVAAAEDGDARSLSTQPSAARGSRAAARQSFVSSTPHTLWSTRSNSAAAVAGRPAEVDGEPRVALGEEVLRRRVVVVDVGDGQAPRGDRPQQETARPPRRLPGGRGRRGSSGRRRTGTRRSGGRCAAAVIAAGVGAKRRSARARSMRTSRGATGVDSCAAMVLPSDSRHGGSPRAAFGQHGDGTIGDVDAHEIADAVPCGSP